MSRKCEEGHIHKLLYREIGVYSVATKIQKHRNTVSKN